MTEQVDKTWSELLIDFPVGQDVMIFANINGLTMGHVGKINEASQQALWIDFPSGGIIISREAYTKIFKGPRDNSYFLAGNTPVCPRTL